jgi:NADH:ubiquinone oxidoreductase subunit 5 (subunit L)/multisubunit Na+/H+ antiporter MnhA subunit
MWVPLVALAIFATIGGFFGIGPAFRFITRSEHPGGRLNIVRFMDPVIWNPQTREFGESRRQEAGGRGQEAEGAASLSGEPASGTSREIAQTNLGESPNNTEKVSPYGTSSFNLAHAVETKLGSEIATEWLFIIISLAVAGFGIGLGLLFYVKDTRLPATWAMRLRPLYQASYNKYWVDEFYGWAVTRRTMDAARAVFAFDSKVIDGAVNGSAWLTRLSSRITGGTDQYLVDGLVNAIAAFIIRLMSPLFRAAQTGFTQNYALVMVLGLVAAVALFFGADILQAFKGIFAIGF